MFRKVLIILSLILTTSILLPYDSAYTHSGRTDANGGHYNRTTGVYHYHNSGTSSRSIDDGEDTYLIAGGIILIGICWILIDPDSCCLMDSEYIPNSARSFLSERPTLPSPGSRFWLPDLKIDIEEMSGWCLQATYTFQF